MTLTMNSHYAAVIADLKGQREKIDQALSALEALLGQQIEGVSVQPPEVSALPIPSDPKPYEGMSIAAAAKAAITTLGAPMTNQQIVDALTRGGMTISSDQPLNVVGSILNRRSREVGDIFRVDRGTWGLTEWNEPEEEEEDEREDDFDVTQFVDLSEEPNERGKPFVLPDIANVFGPLKK